MSDMCMLLTLFLCFFPALLGLCDGESVFVCDSQHSTTFFFIYSTKYVIVCLIIEMCFMISFNSNNKNKNMLSFFVDLMR